MASIQCLPFSTLEPSLLTDHDAKTLEMPHEDLDMPRLPSARPTQSYRQYSDDSQEGKVKQTYYRMNTQQTVEFVRSQHAKWCSLDKAELTMWQVLEMLMTLVDESDPDTKEVQHAHCFQTAERCRELYPDLDWMHLVGLIHDAGKLMALWGQEQWATVGDTFPVGCKMVAEHLYSEAYSGNPDSTNPAYNSELGMYTRNCGLDNVLMSWGHDEYLYQVLNRNENCTIPKIGLDIIRFHSFYTHHQQNAYEHLTTERDQEMREWLRRFQLADLYSKTTELPDTPSLHAYYDQLISKYCPGVLQW